MTYAPGFHPPEVLRLGYQAGIYDELVVDLFAGGGGASTGIELAIKRPVDIAVNHDPAALCMHQANHPYTQHYQESVWSVDPLTVTAGRPVGLLWASPDCTHHSKARGGKPRQKNIRGLAWVVVRWAAKVRPRVICLENVEEFRDWGKLTADNLPDPAHKGKTFDAWVGELKRLGYAVEWRVLRACDYGAPTTRKRLFLVARCDGQPIVFPQPTHGTGRKPYRTAAECIDWSIPCPSIFSRAKPLVDSTCRRIARGMMKFVLENPKPFLVAIDNQTSTGAVWDADKPLSTSTSKARHCLVQPYIVRYHGEKSKTENRGIGLVQPLATQTTENRFGLVAAHITKFKQHSTGTACDEPLHTITAGGHSARPAATPHGMGLVTAFIAKHYGGGENGQQPKGFLPLEPVHTITAQDHHAVVTAQLGNPTEAADNRHLVAAFLTKFYGTGIGQPVSASLDTITTKDRFGLVTVTIDGEEFAITDIGMRMLQPKELFAAQGFPKNYVIDPVYNGKPFSKSLQVRMVGNSVCPDVARAIVMANYVQPAMAEAADD